MTLRRMLCIAGSVVLFAPASMRAQPDSATSSLFDRRDAVALGAFTAATLVVAPFDRGITVALRAPSLQSNSFLHATSTFFRLVGEPGAITGSAAVYAIGRADGSRRASQVGLRSAESIVAATAINYVVKGIVGRARPYAAGDSLPRDYRPGRGFHDRDFGSFASGHTATAFAGAVAAGAEIRQLWPHSSAFWSPALIVSASLVGVSRVYDDQHWASDVVAGAAIGTIVARFVVHANRSHPGNAIDRALLPKGIRNAPVALGWTLTH